jgi:hypothetical protein
MTNLNMYTRGNKHTAIRLFWSATSKNANAINELGCNYTFHSHLPACPDRFAALTGQIDYFQTNP